MDPYKALADSIGGQLMSRVHYNTGYRLIQSAVKLLIDDKAEAISASELVWVDSGELLGRSAVQKIGALGPRTVLFNADDPTGKRDGARFDSLVAALPFYDLCVTVRDETMREFQALGANAIKSWRGCDEVVHAPPDADEIERAGYPGGITFVGTWIRGENRDKILHDLIKAGLPVTIWGDRWSRSKYWPVLRQAWKGGGLRDRNYTLAIASADACLGFLSKGNRDQHTRRSLEAPYIGSVLIAERTPEHQEMFVEGEEALFWDGPEECISACLKILNDKAERDNMRAEIGRAHV